MGRAQDTAAGRQRTLRLRHEAAPAGDYVLTTATIDRKGQPITFGIQHPGARADLVHGALPRGGDLREQVDHLTRRRVALLSHARRDARSRAVLVTFTEPLRPARV